MKMKTVIIIRGTSGAGKSSFAQLIAEPKIVCTADDFFEQDGKYNFDATQLGKAHLTCQMKFLAALDDPNVENIVIANTNTKPSDYKFYVDAAAERNVRVVFVVLEKRHTNENIHSVPSVAIERQYNNLMSDLKLK